MVRRGLLVGRFQPPHLGHLKLIEFALEEVDELIILIAAAQVSHTKKNPFTAGERLEMMRTMIINADIDLEKIWLVVAEDIMDNALWVHHLKRLLPPFHVFFGNNPFTELLFDEAGIETMETPMYDREKYEAARLRDLLIQGKRIDRYIDKGVGIILKRINAKRRFKGIVNNDSKYESSSTKPEIQNMDN